MKKKSTKDPDRKATAFTTEKWVEQNPMMETQIDHNYLNPKKMKFRTNYNATSEPVKLDTTKMTVPGMALTNTEHLKRVKLGLSEKTMKVIYDPEDLFPDIRSLDFVDQKAMLKHARQTVDAIRKKGEEYRKANQKATMEARLKKEQELEAKLLSQLSNKQTK